MKPTSLIDRVLAASEDNNSTLDYAELAIAAAPRLARSLRIAMEALQKIVETWPVEDFGVLYVSLTAKAHLTLSAIAKELEGD